MNPRKLKRLRIVSQHGTVSVGMDRIEIWDGADLALLREVLTTLIEQDGHRNVGVDLTPVKYIPSGFFGMLFEWYEQGVEVHLSNPQPNVQEMLWFRMFFQRTSDGDYLLNDEAVRDNSPTEQVEYRRREFDDQPDDAQQQDESLTAAIRFGLGGV